MLRIAHNTLVYFVAFTLLVIAAVALSNFWLYRQFTDRLDQSLGARLQSTAQAAALLVDAELLIETRGDSSTVSLDYVDLILADRLGEFVQSFGVDEILLLDEEFRLIFDSGETYPLGDVYPYLEMDAYALRTAIESGRSYSPTSKVGNAYLKRGFAPIMDDLGEWSALLVVEADVDFFSLLRTWRRTLTSLTVGIAAILSLLAVLFLRLWSTGDRARRLLVREDKLATLGRMVSQVAHEIRNPLGIIKISGQRLRRAAEDPRQQEMVDYILSEADRLDGIVERYLNFAKGHSRAMEQSSTERLIDEVFREFQRSEPGEIVLKKTIRGPDTVIVDRAQFKQILYNLIQNAVQAHAREVTVVVDVESPRRREMVRWAVEDDGDGIPSRQQKRVFEPFYTTRADGTGLGLSIVEHIAEEHGGSVEVASRRGGGTVVSVVIPLKQATPRHGDRATR